MALKLEEAVADSILKENRLATILKENTAIMGEVSLTKEDIFTKEE